MWLDWLAAVLRFGLGASLCLRTSQRPLAAGASPEIGAPQARIATRLRMPGGPMSSTCASSTGLPLTCLSCGVPVAPTARAIRRIVFREHRWRASAPRLELPIYPLSPSAGAPTLAASAPLEHTHLQTSPALSLVTLLLILIAYVSDPPRTTLHRCHCCCAPLVTCATLT